MTHRRNHRRPAFKNGPGHLLFIECPEILDGAAAPAYDENVQSHGVQGTDPIYDALPGSLSLYQGRIKDQLHIGIPPPADIDDVPDGRPGGGCHDPYGHGISGDRPLILGCKHPHLLQLPQKLFKPDVQVAPACQLDLRRVKLVSSVPLVNVNGPLDHHLLALCQTKAQPLSLACEHDG